jgi:opacity protein-like surface antigen
VLGASASIGRYAKYTTENYEDFNLTADGLYRFAPTMFGVWGVSFGRAHEPRDSVDPSDLVGINPTVYYKAGAYGALSKRFGDNTLKLGITYDGYNFLNNQTFIPPYVINNDDRDRNMYTAGSRLTHDLGNSNRIFVEGSLDVRDYLHTPDDNGFQRDSSGARAAIGWQTAVGENGKAEIFGGLMYQNYQDPRFATILAPDFGALYSWQSDGLTFNASIGRTLEETTLYGVSSYINTVTKFQVSQNLPGNMRLYGGAAYSDRNFQGDGRSDQVTNYWLGARKYYTPYLYLGAEASFEETDSNRPVNDYTESRIMARLGIESTKAYDKDQMQPADWSNSGFYVGAGADITLMGTMLAGPRQAGTGSLIADFGAFGPAGRILAGWGADLEKTYLGLEIDGTLSDAHWNHSRSPGGRVFSVDEQESFGFSFLGGRRLAGGSLAYGRAGLRSAKFVTEYATAGASASYSDSYLGFEYGLGVRTPITGSLALSLEYVHAQYPDYVAGAGRRAFDRFANVTESARIALTYHFGGIRGAGSKADEIRSYEGAYWGLQAGLGGLSSLTRGNRQASSVLTADFGDHGYLGGGLAGYNFQYGRFVAGGEVDASYSHEIWDLEREPAGRVFYVSKQASAGISARAGYVLDAGALVYGRIGAVTAQFRNDLSTMGASLSDTYWHGGFRYGGGIEVPMDDKSQMRFDYSITDYGTLSLATPSGLETYDTKESLFRVGYVRRF